MTMGKYISKLYMQFWDHLVGVLWLHSLKKHFL